MRQSLNTVQVMSLMLCGSSLLLGSMLPGCEGTLEIDCPREISDPDFESTWADDSLRLVIGITPPDPGCADQVTAVGYKIQPDSVWDRLSFTGEVQSVGQVEGSARLFFELVPVASVSDMSLTRDGTTLFLQFTYTAFDGSEQDESFQLQKQL